MNILVTGGAGFIGFHLCRFLLQKNEITSLVVVDSLHPYYDPAMKNSRLEELLPNKKLRFYQQDILESAAMAELFARHQPDAIIHLAAVPGVRGSLHDPLTYVDIDVKGTVQMLELARQYGTKAFLFASSSSVYGERPIHRPFREEDAQLDVASPYAASKLAAEVFCRTYAQLYSMHITCLRFFTVYGPHQRPDMAISRFFRQIAQGEPLTLYDTASKRDYTFVEDIVNGIFAALRRVNGWQVYNLGSGSSPVGLLDLVQLLETVTGKKADVCVLGSQPGDVSGTWADITAARQRLDWEPQVSLQEGLRRYYDWWVSQ